MIFLLANASLKVVELSSPPAGIHLVVGGDTNNGFARGEMSLAWYAAKSRVELSSPRALSPLKPSVYCVRKSHYSLTSHTHVSHSHLTSHISQLTWINPEFPPLILRLYPESAPGLYSFTIYPRYPTTQSLIHYFNMAWNITF